MYMVSKLTWAINHIRLCHHLASIALLLLLLLLLLLNLLLLLI